MFELSENDKKLFKNAYEKVKKFILKNDEKSAKQIIAVLKKDQRHAINFAPNEEDTLLYLSCQNGLADLVEFLIESGADCRPNEITKYTPLYAAIRGGHHTIVELLLKHFPESICDLTTENWSPLHTACINGRNDIFDLLLEYPFKRELLNKYRIGDWEYESAFDPNLLDNFGQTPLYIACLSGNDGLIDKLMRWRLLGTNFMQPEHQAFICPIDLNQQCGIGKESALMAAVRGGFVAIVSSLLRNGINPNILNASAIDEIDSEESSCNLVLLEAVRQKSWILTELLLRFGTKDINSGAIKLSIGIADDRFLHSLLSRECHIDLEHKLNDKDLLSDGNLGRTIPSYCNSYRNLFPSHPTVINWNFINCQLSELKIGWLLGTIHTCNPQLKVRSTVNEISLGAITRIDISHNCLKHLPAEIFQMCSLRYLNAAQNKIENLPPVNTCKYNCPMLEEIYLQDNSLEEIPCQIFRLPSLITLDISNNKLERIPFDMWKAPKLRELSIAFNLLKELPSSRDMDASMLFKFTSTDSQAMTHRGIKNDLIHQNIWSKSLEVVDRDVNQFCELRSTSALRNLNLSNNLFTSIPPALPCLADNLARLNMSYNSLRTMGHVTSYPAFLRQLDLSHNEISCWPSLATVNSADPYLACYNSQCTDGSGNQYAKAPNSMLDTQQTNVYLNLCCHKKHLRLEFLKTLILADNSLTTIQLSTDDITTFSETEDTEWTNIGMTKMRLMYPNLSMLDISNNRLKEMPQFIHKLTNLSILNISGNIDVTELPANMGLLSRLWSMNTKGCSLHGYLQTMIESKKFKTMEIIGYLKSIYEDAKPYARMKLMVVGSQGIGKTSILELLREIYPNQNKKSFNDHWTKRMGTSVASSANSKKKNYNISTVGVDIGDLVCEEKKKNGNSLYGPVVFRTWDFGGQKEYYATHQYFLSKRSLYLVVWRIDEGRNGLIEVLQWLGNIQARATNSPVIIVGTHQDNVGEKITEKEAATLQQYIRDRFIAVTDSEKIGLPKVMSSIEISCKTNYNIKELAMLIYETAFSLRSPGSKETLLHQKVPASYLALEDVIENISAGLKHVGSDPVLNQENFQQMVQQEMVYLNLKPFRDLAELHQATMFLHENGVLLHYNDTTLRDFYFLDPQWLCDILAQVVTIKEINPFVKGGIMKIDDINHLIKSSATGQTNNDRKYILSLLNKFEVALTWDLRTLLIPSLLPVTESDPENNITLKLTSKSPMRKKSSSDINNSQLNAPISRLLLISYFPSGFWSRLMIRILADTQIGEIAQSVYEDSTAEQSNPTSTHWKLWQSGLALYMGDILIFKLREVMQCETESSYRNVDNKYKIKQDGIWSDIELSRSSILDVHFPIDKARRMNMQSVTKLLSLCVDHIDILLEDWYPTLGTRFVHTSEGRFLVTRLIPCPNCLQKARDRQKSLNSTSMTSSNGWLNDASIDETESEQAKPRFLNYTWTIEECILATYDKQILVCPIHGDISVIAIAPDLVFLDIDRENVIRADDLIRGNLIGRGAFGFVFKATLKTPIKDRPTSVAMKMLQPVQPGIRTRKSALLAYKAALEKWRRDPLQHSCKAYFIARQELTVMLNLKHTNIMSLIGVCTQPLALILDCAPKGSLDTIIQSYRQSGYRIGPYCFQSIVLQTSRAIEYLHRSHIIYRDLKAENVLVWQFPESNEGDKPSNNVYVKIADYGISRIALPTGTKGFGGTEGFMAPEIMTHNGEEEYTEKVDCFSFGMFLYELITLRQPFEGNETVKESILEGSRPVFTARELMFPTYCLDLMVLCWDQQPRNRPSASQIVSIACAPEFTHMMDVILLPHSDNLLAMCTQQPIKMPSVGNDASFKLWVLIERCIEIISGYSYGWLTYQRNQPAQMIPLKVDGNATPAAATATTATVTALCNIKSNIIWFGDSKGIIHSYNENENTCAFSYSLDTAHLSAVIAIKCIAGSHIVAAALESGRLFLLDATCYPIKCVNAQDNFVVSEIGVSGTNILCSMTTIARDSRYFEVWCGISKGRMVALEFDSSKTIAIKQHTLKHSSEFSVTLLESSEISVFAYPSPGCVLYQWEVASKKIINQIDCLKLVPCSESLGSISIDKSLSVGRCQITAVCVLHNNVYIGTSWGCLIVADKVTLAPVTVFRPFEEEVQFISALTTTDSSSPPAIVSIGKGYRSLINRYTDIDTPAKRANDKERRIHQTHCILWRAEHWTPI